MERAEIRVYGIVQGVGFRPFIHRLARHYALCGTIRNTASGVELELEGEREALEGFAAALPEEAPALAVIDRVDCSFFKELRGFRDFRILESQTGQRRTLVSPDIGICADCRRELMDPGDRRYRYPFINCTNCGPRFTIIRDLPYDRARTSMAPFPMCDPCAREYHDIENRRYHAQPDCCPDCGPQLFFLDGQGRKLTGDPMETAKSWLREGRILAVKGLGGMHLACRADDGQLVQVLRRRKHRDEKPFALMARDLEQVRRLCRVNEDEARVLEGPRKPIVLLEKHSGKADCLSENRYLGVMLPYTPLHVLLLEEEPGLLVMTSANLSDTPIVSDNEEALEKLSGIADGFLLHNREIQTRCDDSLCWVQGGTERFIRRSRGYVPQPLRVPGCRDGILACGAEQKASFCLSRGEHVFPSQHIGDLKNYETLAHYEDQIRHFERLFDIQPKMLVCDRHPDYLSTAYARDRAERENLPLLQVQHHAAHMAACMADNGLSGPCIGLVWDGTGYGEDGTVWGGECLVGGYESTVRFGSIRPIPLIGGDRAVKELDRLAFALLTESGCDTGALADASCFSELLAAGLNCPLSSGMGRLFDGVAAILGIKHIASYEGQGAVLLEAAAAGKLGEPYPLQLEGEPLCFDWRPMIRAMVRDRDAGLSAMELAGRFHATLVALAAEQSKLAAKETGIRDVVLSGGSFQNRLLSAALPEFLEARGLRPWLHRRVSCNDEGISLGQLMIASHRT